MIIVELGLIIITLTSTLLHIFTTIEGAALIQIISLALLSTLYFYFGNSLFNPEKRFKLETNKSYLSSTRIAGGYFAGIAIAVALIGTLFKLMIWPGFDIMLNSSIFTLLIIAAVILYKVFTGVTLKSYAPVLIRAIFFGILAIGLKLIPLKTMADLKHPDNPYFADLVVRLYENPDDPDIREEYENLLEVSINSKK